MLSPDDPCQTTVLLGVQVLELTVGVQLDMLLTPQVKRFSPNRVRTRRLTVTLLPLHDPSPNLYPVNNAISPFFLTRYAPAKLKKYGGLGLPIRAAQVFLSPPGMAGTGVATDSRPEPQADATPVIPFVRRDLGQNRYCVPPQALIFVEGPGFPQPFIRPVHQGAGMIFHQNPGINGQHPSQVV